MMAVKIGSKSENAPHMAAINSRGGRPSRYYVTGLAAQWMVVARAAWSGGMTAAAGAATGCLVHGLQEGRRDRRLSLQGVGRELQGALHLGPGDRAAQADAHRLGRGAFGGKGVAGDHADSDGPV